MTAPSFAFTAEVRPVCQIGLGARAPEPAEWLDVSCYVHEAELFRGRDRFTDRFEPGTASITFDNRSGWADLVGAPAAVAAQTVRPGRPIRVGVEGPWEFATATIRWLWRGWIDQATPAYDPVLHDIVTVNCIDALGEAGHHVVPTGPEQGVNETATARMHRVLDAGGWFAAKRKIASSTTTVQGTTLGAQGADLMGQTADSAGGVVFGDLDGDVVFKDLNWELYDPDTPPDGIIGNVDPGTPGIPYTPGYIDPEKGYVYWPDPPPITGPTVFTFCADGTDGTIIEQGPEARIIVRGGRLWFESSGHTWDLGPYDGGCVGVGFDPGGNGGLGDVTRWDDPEDDGTWTETGSGEEVTPPVLSVELLAWSDGGAAEGPQASVTLAGVAPGPGALLVLLASGVCSVGALSPLTITGGGLTWELVEQMVAGADGAESYIFACRGPRTDPGTFAVVLDWMLERTSRHHAVTLWRVNTARADMYERLVGGIAGRAVTNDYPSNAAAPPGQGFQQVELANDAPVPYFTAATDIAIAQSLAEEGTGPFGATFNDADGVWTVEPALAPGLLEAICDDFERADGPLGSAWATALTPGWADNFHPLTIASGKAVATVLNPSSAPYDANSMRWATAQGADQVIEAEIEVDSGSTGAYCYLYTNASDVDHRALFVDFQLFGGEISISVTHFDADGNFAGSTSTDYAHATSGIMRLRLETDADGTFRVFVDDVLAWDGVDPNPAIGPGVYVGFGTERSSTQPEVRFLEVCVGGGATPTAKTSWVAGWRTGAVTDLVAWTDVNTGVDDIQSTQAAVVVEADPLVGFGRRILDYSVHDAGEPGGGTFTRIIRPAPGSVVVVFISALEPTDISAALTVTSPTLTFASKRTHGPAVDSIAQGAIWTAKVPTGDGLDTAVAITIGYGPTSPDRLSWVVYEITGADAVGTAGSASAGNGSGGSATGPLTVTLDDPPAATSVVLGFLGVTVEDSPTETGAEPGTGWIEELEYLPPALAWMQTQAREGSTSDLVEWAEIAGGAGGARATDAVALAVEVTPSAEFVLISDPSFPLVIGGEHVAFNGPIYKAERRTGVDPNGGTVVWTMEPV